MMSMIHEEINSHKEVVNKTMENLQSYIYTSIIIVNETLKNGHKIYMFGDESNSIISDYLSFKMNQKFNKNIAFSLKNEIMNNDNIDLIYENQIKKLVNVGDLLIGFSTSGNSKSTLRGLSIGKTLGCKSIGFSGYDGGAMHEFCDLNLVVSSENIERIQEMHLLLGNIISQLIEYPLSV